LHKPFFWQIAAPVEASMMLPIDKEKFFDWFILAHILLGILVSISKTFMYLPTLGVLLVGLIWVVGSRNQRQTAHLLAGYLVGMEVLLRMARLSLPSEFTKYAVALLLLAGVLSEKRNKVVPRAIFLYFFVLLPSSLLLDISEFDNFRQQISFNLSGPFSLCISMWYFYKRRLTFRQIREMSIYILAPLMSLSVYLSIKASNFSSYSYTHSANFSTSGGFGPNQVSTALGLGITIFFIFFLFKKRLIKSKILTFGFLFILAFRGIITFSRGGFLAPFFALFASFIMMKLRKKEGSKKGWVFIGPLFLAIIGILSMTWIANRISDDVLTERYLGVNSGKTTTHYFSGREQVVALDLKMFLMYPLAGVGPGKATELRQTLGFGRRVAAHNELSRLLAEHGLLGFIAICILFYFSFQLLFVGSISHEQLVFSTSCLAFSFFSMSHSAMRLAAMGFVFGMAFISINPDGRFASGSLINFGKRERIE